MPTFAETFRKIRNERHITQEQLAKEMNVSRQTISHWENGRAVPDIDAIKHLSKVLDYNLLAVEGEDHKEASEQAASGEDAVESPPCVRKINISLRKHASRIIIAAVLGCVLLCAALMAFLLPKDSSAREQARVLITAAENPVRAIRFDEFPDGVGWFYGFRIEETAGIPFTIHQLDSILINDNGREDAYSYTGEQAAEWWGSDTLVQNSPQSLDGGFPLQDVKGVRIVLTGTDANGNELTFEGSLELSKEIAE